MCYEEKFVCLHGSIIYSITVLHTVSVNWALCYCLANMSVLLTLLLHLTVCSYVRGKVNHTCTQLFCSHSLSHTHTNTHR